MTFNFFLRSKVWTLSSELTRPDLDIKVGMCCFVWDSLISSVSELIVFLCRVFTVINTSGCPRGVTSTRGTQPQSQASHVIRVSGTKTVKMPRWCWTFDSLMLRNVYGFTGIFFQALVQSSTMKFQMSGLRSFPTKNIWPNFSKRNSKMWDPRDNPLKKSKSALNFYKRILGHGP